MTTILPLVETTMKVSLLILLALGSMLLLRSRSAAARHWVLSAAIVCATAMPFLQVVVPAWHVPLTPAAIEPRARATEIAIAVGGTAQEHRATAAPPSVRPDIAITKSAFHLLEAIWLTGVAFSLSLLLVGFARLTWLAAKSEQIAGGTWTAVANRVSREYGLAAPVRLLQSDHPTLLVTWGLVRPKVILPASARGWTESRIRVVVAHELAHIARRDWLVQMAAQLLRSIQWFNPLVWIGCTRLRQESEHACDDAALGLGVDGSEYATHLLDLARAFALERRSIMSGFPAPEIVRPSSLERRISAMLNKRLNRRPITRSTRIATAIALTTLTCAVAGFAAQAAFATLSGTISDPSGAIVPNAKVALTHVQSRTKHEVQSNEAGYFEFVGLTAGDYQLEAQFIGFAPLREQLTLTAGQTLQRNLSLQLGSVEETVNVFDRPPEESPRRSSPRARAEAKPCSASPIGGRIQPPVKLADVKPRYPQELRDAGIEGRVSLEGRIGLDGFVKDMRIVEAAHPDLGAAALEAVNQWQFDATRLNCNPVETNITVMVNFKAQQ